MIKLQCPGCGQKLAVKDTLAGKRAKCPGCGDPVAIPLTQGAAPAEVSVPVQAPAPISAPLPMPTPAPARARVAAPVPIPAPLPAAPVNPFGFDARSPAAETLPSVFVDTDLTAPPLTMPRRKRKSPVKSWAVHGAILGAAAGAAAMVYFKVEDTQLVVAIRQMFQQATPEKIRGALLGAVAGLAIAGMLLALVGRGGEALFATLLLVAGGGVYGAFRESHMLETGLMMPVLGGIAGVVGGAILGSVIGGIIAAGRGKKRVGTFDVSPVG